VDDMLAVRCRIDLVAINHLAHRKASLTTVEQVGTDAA